MRHLAVTVLAGWAAGNFVFVSACVPQDNAGRHWLFELTDRCWMANALDVEACFWRAAPHRIDFMSRSSEGLLGCGTLDWPATSPDAGPMFVRSWDERGVSERQAVSINERNLVQREPSTSGPQDVGYVTTLSRPERGRFTIRKFSLPTDYATPMGEPGHAATPALDFVESSALATDDQDRKRCRELDPELIPPAPVPAR